LSDDVFARVFGRDSEVAASAPGRVNLIGEHTDYNGGFVLPTAIPQKTTASVARRADRRVRAWSADFEDLGIVQYELGREKPRHLWLDYVAGVTRELSSDASLDRGFDLSVESDVPVGGGLSSSAALEVSVLKALREAFALELDDIAIAKIGQRAENRFVGAPVGIMDQMAASLGEDRTALFLDARSLAFERVPIPTAAALVVIDSGIEHSHAVGEYRTRRAECEQAARALGVRQLRDATISDLDRLDRLPPVLARRARHVITEDARVIDAVAALRVGDLPRLGGLIDLSHASLSKDFEVSTPEIDRLVSIARRQRGVLGARLTGGGFGGSILAIAERGGALEAADRTVREYGAHGHPRAKRILPTS
jgi:galactokinase